MRPLRSLDLDLETFTPLLTGGADMRPELRPPSFRGLLRFWFRALLNGFLEGDLSRLRQVEEAVFGGPACGSSIVVRVPRGDVAAGPLPANPPPGLQYLLWSAYASRRQAIPPGQRFTLRMQGRPLLRQPLSLDGRTLDEAAIFSLAAASLWLLLRLGTLGFRSRRGAGTLRVLAHPPAWPQDIPSPLVQATTPAELAAELAAALSGLRAWVGLPTLPVSGSPAALNTLHPDTCEIHLLDRAFPSWQEAMEQVGAAFKAFRHRQPEDYDLVKGVLTRTRSAVQMIKRAIFGLPLPFFFRSLYQGLLKQGLPPQDARRRASATVVPTQGERRSSPLFLRFLPLAGDAGACVPAVILFRSRFLPEMTLQVRPVDRSLPPFTAKAPADFSFIQEWFRYLAQEVAPLLPVSFQ
jgi:CRISPR-associated protein Cmr1